MQSLKVTHFLILAFLLSFCSFNYELVIAKALSEFTGRPLIWQSFTIGIYILGLGIGAFIADSKFKKFSLSHFFKLETTLSICGGLSIVLIMIMHIIYRVYFINNVTDGWQLWNDIDDEYYTSWLVPFILFIVGSQLITLLVGILSGFEIPLLISLSKQSGHKNIGHKILGYNALGTLAAAIIFSFVLLPKFDLIGTSLITASLNFAICIALCFVKDLKKRIYEYSMLLACITVISVATIYSSTLEKYNLKTFYYYSLYVLDYPMDKSYYFDYMALLPEVERHKSLYQNIDIALVPRDDYGENIWQKDDLLYSLFLDQREQFYSETQAEYHRTMAFTPINIINHVPKEILVLGGGDSLLTHQLLKLGHKLKHITQIELDPKMAELADTHPAITRYNEIPTKNPKLTRIIGDGFYFLRNSKKKFDAIYIDFPYPDDYDKGRLYSVEFYQYVVNNLNDNGFAIMDIPLTSQTELDNIDKYYHHEMMYNNNMILNTADNVKGDYLPFHTGEDSFILFFNKNNPNFIKQAKTIPHYKSFDVKSLDQPTFGSYPYIKDKKYSNSIFKPIILGIAGFN